MGIFNFLKKKAPAKEDSEDFKKLCPPEVIEHEEEMFIEALSKGNLSDQFTSNVLLKKGERLIFAIPQIVLAEERTSSVKGTYMGLSIRIMKGVSLRPGVFEAGAEKKVMHIDEGNFTLTSKRLIFTGEKQSREFLISDINSIIPTDNGIGINRKGKNKTEYYLGTQNMSISFTIEPDLNDNFDATDIEFNFSGYHIQKIVQKLLVE